MNIRIIFVCVAMFFTANVSFGQEGWGEIQDLGPGMTVQVDNSSAYWLTDDFGDQSLGTVYKDGSPIFMTGNGSVSLFNWRVSEGRVGWIDSQSGNHRLVVDDQVVETSWPDSLSTFIFGPYFDGEDFSYFRFHDFYNQFENRSEVVDHLGVTQVLCSPRAGCRYNYNGADFVGTYQGRTYLNPYDTLTMIQVLIDQDSNPVNLPSTVNEVELAKMAGQWLVVGTDAREIWRCDLETGQWIELLAGPQELWNSFAVDPTGNVAWESWDGSSRKISAYFQGGVIDLVDTSGDFRFLDLQDLSISPDQVAWTARDNYVAFNHRVYRRKFQDTNAAEDSWLLYE